MNIVFWIRRQGNQITPACRTCRTYLDCSIHLLLHACARQGAELKQYSMTCGIVWLMNIYLPTHSFVYYTIT